MMNEKSVSAAEEPREQAPQIVHRSWGKIVAIVYSTICMMLLMFAGIIGMFFGPLFFARHMPNAPLAWPVQWLQTMTGGNQEAFNRYYPFLCTALLVLILPGCGLYFRMCRPIRKK